MFEVIAVSMQGEYVIARFVAEIDAYAYATFRNSLDAEHDYRVCVEGCGR